MNAQSVIRPVVLTTVAVGTAFVVNSFLTKELNFEAENAKVNDESLEKKERAIAAAKVIGIGIVTVLASQLIANAVSTSVDQALWPSTDTITIEATIE